VSLPPVRVVKLGGSLLDWPELASAARHWLSLQPPAAHVLIVGGGAMVDALRQLDACHRLSPEAAHWLAIRLMGITAQLAQQLWPEARLAHALSDPRLHEYGCTILDIESLARDDACAADGLPCDWQVTSDSLAARAANRLGADELVLLKSALPGGGACLAEWARQGYVDTVFPRAAGQLRVRGVDLRSVGFPEVHARMAPRS